MEINAIKRNNRIYDESIEKMISIMWSDWNTKLGLQSIVAKLSFKLFNHLAYIN